MIPFKLTTNKGEAGQYFMSIWLVYKMYLLVSIMFHFWHLPTGDEKAFEQLVQTSTYESQNIQFICMVFRFCLHIP